MLRFQVPSSVQRIEILMQEAMESNRTRIHGCTNIGDAQLNIFSHFLILKTNLKVYGL
ncbi:hypothetical protein Plhal304r1_c054g0139471 [Plasmopara halstedii]